MLEQQLLPGQPGGGQLAGCSSSSQMVHGGVVVGEEKFDCRREEMKLMKKMELLDLQGYS